MNPVISTNRNALSSCWSKILRFGATSVVLAVVGSFLFAQSGVEDGPQSIQRLVIPPQRIARELEKVKQGTLVMMPLADFDIRVERADKSLKSRGEKPRLTRTHYSAELVDRSLSFGSGQWTIQYAGAGSALLPIEPMSLALANAKWEQGGDATLAEFDGKSLGLLVPSPAHATCLFDWSARGTLTNEGLIFNLAVPPCPLTTFELKLPVDYWLSAPKSGVLVTGPHDVGSASHRLWKLQVTGATELDINVRRIAEPTGPAPTIFAQVHSIQQLTPERVNVDHEYQIDVLHGSLRELVLHGDAALEPTDVSLKSGGVVKSWQWQTAPAKKDAKGKEIAPAGTLTIQFHQPVQGKMQGLRVRSQTARPGGPVWVSPVLRVHNALLRGETLAVQLHPDVPLGVWDSGTFQQTSLVTESDGTQILGLAETAFAPGQSRRPTLAFPPPGIDVATIEQYHWHIAPRHAELTAQIQFAPMRGSMFELPIKLLGPAGYQVESLDVIPPDLLRGWEPRGPFVVVELKQPLTPGKKVQVKLVLRTGLPALVAGSRVLTCPEIQPTDGARREGTLTVAVDPGLQGQMVDASGPLASTIAPSTGAPTWRMTLRGRKYGATMRVASLPVQVQMRGKHHVSLSELDANMQFHWDVEPVFGAPEFLDFRLAPGVLPGWRVKADNGSGKIHHWERLYLQEALPHLLRLGARDGMQNALLASVLPDGAYWRFHLDEPLKKKMSFTLDATAPPGFVEQDRLRLSLRLPHRDPWQIVAGALVADSLPAARGARTWSIPLMTPVQSDNASQEIVVESPLEPINTIALEGPQWMRPFTPGKTPAQVQLEQAVGPGHDRSAQLIIATRLEKNASSPSERCDEASITTCLRKDGYLWRRIAFRLWHWRDRTVDLHLPADAVVVSVKLNNRWLESQSVQARDDGVLLSLPFDQNVDFVRYEILVRTQARSVLPGLTRIDAPVIQWPTTPLDLQQRVCLENGWLPIEQDGMAPIGVPACCRARSETTQWLKRAWSFGRSWLPSRDDADRLEQLDRQRQTVLLAEAQMRAAAAGKPIKLGDAIDLLTMSHLKDAAPLIIDRVALRSLGLTSATLLPASAMTPQARPFWEGVGLVYEPCPSGALLTSPQRLQSLGIDGPGRASEIDPAIREAILHGRDSSGGFVLSVAWLRLPTDPAAGFFGETFASSASNSDSSDVSEWELSSESGRGGFYVFDPLAARVASAFLIVLAALLLWWLQRSTSAVSCFRLHVLMLTATILALAWWPASVREFVVLPALVVITASLVVCLTRLRRSPETPSQIGGSTIIKPAAQSAGLALLFLGFTWAALAQPASPRAYSVYLLEGQKPMVLVPSELVGKLDEWSKPPVVAAKGPVLVRAKYTGRVKDATARFDVEYQIHCGKDGNLVIPLSGVQLHDGAFLDGVPVFPSAHEAGYALPIKGQGTHHLRLSFGVRVAGNADHLDLKFTTPRLVQSAVQVDWATPAPGLQCLHCSGEEKRNVDGKQAVSEWRGQLGAEKSLHLRWTNTGAQPAPKMVKVAEAHFWDLRPASESLTSLLHYTVGAGTLNQLNVALSDGLFVRGVDAFGQPQASTQPQPLLIKHWHIVGKGGQRRLVVDLAQPSSGTILLHLDVVPQLSVRERKLLLRLPAPLQADSTTGLVGYRLDADENPSAQDITVQSVTPDDFDALWKKAGGAAIVTASRAYRFQRKSQQAGLELDVRGDTRQAQCVMQWSLEPHHADLVARFTLKSSFDDLMLLEFNVDPGLTLTDVVGVDVKRWHLRDSLLQVWLRQPRKQAALDVIGWQMLPYKANAPGKRTFGLPRVLPRGIQIVKTDLELRPAAGVRVEEERLRRLNPPYQAAVTMSLVGYVPEAAALTKVLGTPQGMEFAYSVHVPTERGRLPVLTLHAKDWQADAPRLDAPGALVRPVTAKGIKHPAWSLQYPPGMPQEVVITLRSRMEPDKQGQVRLPGIELEGAKIGHAWVAWKDVELFDGRTKLIHQRGAKENIAQQTGDVGMRTATGWSGAEWSRPLQALLPKTPTPSSVRILASSESIRRTQGRWLHEATLWVHAPEAGELRMHFPADLASSFSALANQRLLTVNRTTSQDVVLPIAASPEPRMIELRWRYAAGAESPRAPNLAAVQIDQDLVSSPVRVLWIPRDMSADTRPAPTLFEQLVQEAYTHLQIAAALADDPQRTAATTRQIAARQQQFYACLRQAEYAAGLIKHVQADFDRGAQAERLKDLKRENAKLAKERRYEEQRASAQKGKKSVEAPAPTEFAGLGTPILLPPAASSLTLQSVADRIAAEQSTRSELVLLGAVAVLLFSMFRRSFALTGRLAPEIAIAACILAMLGFGLSLVALIVVGLMVLVRLAWFVTRLQRRHAEHIAEVSTANARPPDSNAPPAG